MCLQEIYEQLRDGDVTNPERTKQLGHLERIVDQRLPNKEEGAVALRYLDDVLKDLTRMYVGDYA